MVNIEIWPRGVGKCIHYKLSLLFKLSSSDDLGIFNVINFDMFLLSVFAPSVNYYSIM